MCVKCGSVAEEVHHVEPLTPSNISDPMISLHENNLQSLCRTCHFKEHERKKAPVVVEGYEFDDEGYLVKVKSQ